MNSIHWSEWVEDDNYCIDCGNYSPDSAWCDECLDKLDIDEHEERKRERLAEQQEY